MITLLLLLIFSIFYGMKLIKKEKIKTTTTYKKRSKSSYFWIITGLCTILLIWFYFSWDLTRTFYPNSANALCQGAKISQSLIAIKYILPVEEKNSEGSIFVLRENKIINNLKSKIEMSNFNDKNYFIYLINEIEKIIESLSAESNLKKEVKDKLISVSNKINILTDSIQEPNYPDYQSLNKDELKELSEQGSWRTSDGNIPYQPTTERGLKLDAAAKEMKKIVDEFLQIKNNNPLFLKKSKTIGQEIDNYRKTLIESQQLEINFIEQISKISARVISGNIFPPSALNDIKLSLIKFDEIQQRESTFLRMLDTWLFPGGTIVVNNSICMEQGLGKWLIKPTDYLREIMHLFKLNGRSLV